MSNAKEKDELNSDSKHEHPESGTPKISIGSVIECFVHRVLDIEECADKFVSLAAENYNKNSDRLNEECSKNVEIVDGGASQEEKTAAIGRLRKCQREIERHNNSKLVPTLEKSLFVFLFAAFDKYIGDLLAALFNNKESLYKGINRDISLSDALSFGSIDALRQAVLDKEIEILRRKSYSEQFSDLEKRFSISLTKFKLWPDFIECAQRRNLFTHCDGVVSKQYIESCLAAGYKFEKKPGIGDQLSVGADYFIISSHLVLHVAIMLGHTLWRKVMPEELETADNHLNSLVFDFLHMEEWLKAIGLSQFSMDLPKKHSDVTERISYVNYAIALKAVDEKSAAQNILKNKDWSATSYDFKIAHAVLNDDFDEAKSLMLKIGREGDLITEMTYHDWPLFRDFRSREEFLDGYEKVFGYKYSSKLSPVASAKAAALSNQGSTSGSSSTKPRTLPV